MPRELLALKINACRMALDALPDVSITIRSIRKVPTPVCLIDNHMFTNKSIQGKHCFELAGKRESYATELKDLESKWYGTYKCGIPEDLIPRKVVRKFINHIGEPVVINKEFFDSLENDADPEYPENKKYFFNGVYYRSVAEKEIAEFYTINNIPFKYEPEIWIKGLSKPIHPDFVIYIRELDCCKFHEHIGMLSFVNYLRMTKNKYQMYIEAGLIPDFDIFFTYDTEEIPFDIRTMWPRLNQLVYCSLFSK